MKEREKKTSISGCFWLAEAAEAANKICSPVWISSKALAGMINEGWGVLHINMMHFTTNLKERKHPSNLSNSLL